MWLQRKVGLSDSQKRALSSVYKQYLGKMQGLLREREELQASIKVRALHHWQAPWHNAVKEAVEQPPRSAALSFRGHCYVHLPFTRLFNCIPWRTNVKSSHVKLEQRVVDLRSCFINF